MESNSKSVIIIGGGAAGSTCALFLARAGIPCLILDNNKTVLRRAYLHNFPGIDPILGVDWLTKVHSQLIAFPIFTYIETTVNSVRAVKGCFEVSTENGAHFSEILVLATGQVPYQFIELSLQVKKGEQPFVKNNLIVTADGETEIPGVYACGLLAGFPSEAVVCAGSGARVAISIASKLKGTYWVDHDNAPPASSME